MQNAGIKVLPSVGHLRRSLFILFESVCRSSTLVCLPPLGLLHPVICTHHPERFVSHVMQIRERSATINSMFADGLAVSNNAPAFFLKTSKSGLPYLCVIFCSLFTLLAFMAVKSGAGKVFTWLANMTSVAGLMTWFGITITYLRFYKGLKRQGIDRTTLPFYTRSQPYAAWYGCCSTFIICFVSPFFISPREVMLTSVLVQRMERVPQGSLGHCNLRYQLFTLRPFPHSLSRCAPLLPHLAH